MNKIIIVFFSTIDRTIHIPGREINAELHPLIPTCLGQLSYHITFPVFPRTTFNRMFRIITWPQTKTIVMLCSNNDEFHTGIFASFNPLSGIQLAGIKNLWVFFSITPFSICKCIDPKMKKGC